MSPLRKLIVLTPEQLQRLRGRNLAVTDQYDANRLQVLQSVAKKVKDIGPSQAYAHYQAAQQRHLHHAAKDRTEPLQMTLADSPAAPPTLQEQLQKLEQDQSVREHEDARLALAAKRALALRKAGRLVGAKKRQKEEGHILKTVRRAAEKRTGVENASRVNNISPLKTRSQTLKKGAEHLMKNRGEATWISLRH